MPKRVNQVLLNVDYIEQSERSANCGPCSVKSILDYFCIVNNKKRPYSVHSLNRLLMTSSKYGIEEEVIKNFLLSVGLPIRNIDPSQIVETLLVGTPILASFEDEFLEGHYAVIVGAQEISTDNPMLIFQDPWPQMGQEFQRRFNDFCEQVKNIQGELLAVGESL